MRGKTLAVLLLGVCASAHSSCSTDGPHRASESQTTDDRYEELRRKGETAVVAGDLATAEAAFHDAAAVHLFEAPNFEILVRIADVKCRRGDAKGALAVLRDFRCMLAIDSGQIHCFVDGRVNPELSAECVNRMCSEMYLPYYEAPTEEQLKSDERLAREADRIEMLCSKGSN